MVRLIAIILIGAGVYVAYQEFFGTGIRWGALANGGQSAIDGVGQAAGDLTNSAAQSLSNFMN